MFNYNKQKQELEKLEIELKKELAFLREEIQKIKESYELSLKKEDELLNTMSLLLIKMDFLSSEIKKTHTSDNISKGENNQTVPKPVEEQPVIKYVQQLNEDFILNEDLMDSENKFTKFILTIVGKKATFEVPSNPLSQEKIFSSYYQLSPFIKTIDQVPSPKSIENVKAGKLELKDGVWNVVEKLQVNLK